MRSKKQIIQKLQQLVDKLPKCEKRNEIIKRIIKLKLKK